MLLLEGIKLMVVGMGVVFCFLGLLVAAMRGASGICQHLAHLFPEPEPVAARSASRRDELAEVALALAAAKVRAGD